METGLPTTPDAGWFPDPDDATQLRYWDGTAWTEHRHGSTGQAEALTAVGSAEPGRTSDKGSRFSLSKKTDDEREAERRAKEASRAAQAARDAEAAFRASPVGQARTAREQGHGFFEIQLDVGHSTRDVAFGRSDFQRSEIRRSYTDMLSGIEAEGWTLMNVGYVFVVTGESSRDKFLASGQNVAVSGKTVGIYLFKAQEPADV